MNAAAGVRRRAVIAGLLVGGGVVRAQTGSSATSTTETLQVGLVPYISTRTLLGLYEPMRKHLEAELQRPVQLFTAADFRALAENTRNDAYALALLPAHIARIAAADWGHTLVARSSLISEVQLVALRVSPPDLPIGLRGKRIAAIDPLSLTSLVLDRWLAQRGLVSDRDVEVVHLRSIGSAALAVQRGDAVALVGAIGQLRDLGLGETADLVKIATLAEIPTPVFVAHPVVPPAEVALWRRALIGFIPPDGADKALSRTPFVPAQLSDLDSVERYAQAVRRLLRSPKTEPLTGDTKR